MPELECLLSRYHYLGFSTVGENARYMVFDREQNPLACYISGRVAKRISADWMMKYGHPIYLLETFVERDRLLGTCYQAANWICVGQTKGRSRNDRYATLKVPVKDIYLYPLVKGFRDILKQRVDQEASS